MLDCRRCCTTALLQAFDGAGLDVRGSNLHLLRSNVSHNVAAQRGGALLSFDAAGEPITAINIDSCSITNNTASQENGGALGVSLCKMTVTDSIFSHNTALQQGGAVYADQANVTLRNTAFTGNTATYGGAVHCDAGASGWLRIINNSMTGNGGSDVVDGGAVLFRNGSLSIVSSSISNNTASNTGGALQAAHASVAMSACLIQYNTVLFGMAGGVHVLQSAVDMNTTLFSHNQVR